MKEMTMKEMTMTETTTDELYHVVVNHEEQYSIWLAGEEPPKGWAKVGDSCALKDCHKKIEEVWTDMRPLSLLKIMKAEKLDSREAKYAVVINHEEQYSIWLADREVPTGWKPVDFQGSKEKCMDYIEEVWTDMRPLSLRARIEETHKR
jgi:MbtH protein